MKALITVNSRLKLEFQAESTEDVFKKVSFWQSLPSKCPRCDGEIGLQHKIVENYQYLMLICDNQHNVNLSKRGADGQIYLDKSKLNPSEWLTTQEKINRKETGEIPELHEPENDEPEIIQKEFTHVLPRKAKDGNGDAEISQVKASLFKKIETAGMNDKSRTQWESNVERATTVAALEAIEKTIDILVSRMNKQNAEEYNQGRRSLTRLGAKS